MRTIWSFERVRCISGLPVFLGCGGKPAPLSTDLLIHFEGITFSVGRKAAPSKNRRTRSGSSPRSRIGRCRFARETEPVTRPCARPRRRAIATASRIAHAVSSDPETLHHIVWGLPRLSGASDTGPGSVLCGEAVPGSVGHDPAGSLCNPLSWYERSRRNFVAHRRRR